MKIDKFKFFCNNCKRCLPSKIDDIFSNYIMITGNCCYCKKPLYDENNKFLGIKYKNEIFLN